jgi:adenosylcobinamide amidohydrolase
MSSTLYATEDLTVALHERCVVMRARGPHVCLSHAPHRGPLRSTQTVAIHETRNDELTLEVDPIALLATRMAAVDARGVGMWTSRRVSSAVVHTAAVVQGLRAVALVTAGLSNAVRVGDTPGPLAGWGTINVACHVDVPLTASALVEAFAVVVEARTTAVLEAHVRSRRSDSFATGTGTDCVAVLAPKRGPAALPYAGKHTPLGHVVGEAVLRAVETAIAAWKRELAY